MTDQYIGGNAEYESQTENDAWCSTSQGHLLGTYPTFASLSDKEAYWRVGYDRINYPGGSATKHLAELGLKNDHRIRVDENGIWGWDGSQWVNLITETGDNLGSHSATKDLTLEGFDIEKVGTVYHSDSTRWLTRVSSDGLDSGTLYSIGMKWDSTAGVKALKVSGYTNLRLGVQANMDVINIDVNGMDMNQHQISDLPAPSADNDAARKTYVDGKVSDVAYNTTSWNGVTTIAPSKNTIRDQLVSHYANVSEHHTKYTNTNAVSAMGTKANDNPLHHDRTVNTWRKSQLVVSTYTGNGTNDFSRSFGYPTGYHVVCVIILANTTSIMYIKTQGMPTTYAKNYADLANDVSQIELYGDLTGFKVANNCNLNGVAYTYILMFNF